MRVSERTSNLFGSTREPTDEEVRGVGAKERARVETSLVGAERQVSSDRRRSCGPQLELRLQRAPLRADHQDRCEIPGGLELRDDARDPECDAQRQASRRFVASFQPPASQPASQLARQSEDGAKRSRPDRARLLCHC